MPIVVTTRRRQAVSESTYKPTSALKPMAGIQCQSVIPVPWSPNPKP